MTRKSDGEKALHLNTFPASLAVGYRRAVRQSCFKNVRNAQRWTASACRPGDQLASPSMRAHQLHHGVGERVYGVGEAVPGPCARAH